MSETPEATGQAPDGVTAEADQIAEEIAEARATFTLADRLQGIKHRTGKVLVYTDLPAVDAYAAIVDERTPVAQLIERLVEAVANPKAPATHAADLAEAQNELAEIDARLADARAAMTESGMVINLIGYPAIAQKVARREARKKFGDPALGGDIPEDRIEEAQDFMDLQLLGASVVSVIDVTTRSAMALPARAEIGQMLVDFLPLSQFVRVKQEWSDVTTKDRITQDALDEPGF